MIDLEFLHQLEHFSLIVRKRITSSYTGERKTAYTGRGLIFKDHGIYAPGEDFRRIDWKVFARTDKLFVKRFEEERNLTVHIVIDASASMNFGHPVSKMDYASMVALGFSYLALKNNERFVISTFSDKLELFKPKKGRSQLSAMVKFLQGKKPKGVSNFESSMASYKKLINSKSMIVIVSDFFYPPEEIRNTLYRYRQHDIRLVQVLDKVERNMNIEGDFKLKDLETGSVLRTFISPFLKRRYFKKLAGHTDLVQKYCDEAGALFYSTDTGQNIFDSMARIMMKNGR